MRRTSAATLGDKLAFDAARFRRWEPIKTFANDDSELALDRMIGAMASFGVSNGGDAGPLSSAGSLRDPTEWLAAQHETRRVHHGNGNEYRAMIE